MIIISRIFTADVSLHTPILMTLKSYLLLYVRQLQPITFLFILSFQKEVQKPEQEHQTQ